MKKYYKLCTISIHIFIVVCGILLVTACQSTEDISLPDDSNGKQVSEPQEPEALPPEPLPVRVEACDSISGVLFTLDELEDCLIHQTEIVMGGTAAGTQGSGASAGYYYYMPSLTLEGYCLDRMQVTEYGYFYMFIPESEQRIVNGLSVITPEATRKMVEVQVSAYIETDDIEAFIEESLGVPRAYYGDFYDSSHTTLVTILDDHHYAMATFPESMAPYQNIHGLISYRKVTVNPDAPQNTESNDNENKSEEKPIEAGYAPPVIYFKDEASLTAYIEAPSDKTVGRVYGQPIRSDSHQTPFTDYYYLPTFDLQTHVPAEYSLRPGGIEITYLPIDPKTGEEEVSSVYYVAIDNVGLEDVLAPLEQQFLTKRDEDGYLYLANQGSIIFQAGYLRIFISAPKKYAPYDYDSLRALCEQFRKITITPDHVTE